MTMRPAFAAGAPLPRAARRRAASRCTRMTTSRVGVARVRAASEQTFTQEIATSPAIALPPPALPPLARASGMLALAMAALIALLRRATGKSRDDDEYSKPMMMSSSVAGNGAGRQSLAQRLGGIIPPENERKKLLPLGLMFFVILFNYTILRDTKDVLVVTAAGAEIIPFLKTYVNLPGAILFTIAYSKMSNMFSRETLFYICIIPFVLFFLAFGFFIYPNLATLHPVSFVAWLATKLPPSAAAPLAIIKNWTFAVFYTLAELWGSVVVSLLFWGFANEVTTVDEAKKYYPLFGLGANVALIFSGQYVRFVSDIRAKLPPGVDGWAVSLRYLMSMVAFGGAVIIGCYYYMQRKIMTDPKLVDLNKRKQAKVKTKLGMRESAKYLMNSKYIRNLAMLVIAYGMSINIVEVTWKSRLRAAFPDPNSYSAFMGNFSSATGVATFIMMLAGRYIFRRYGWGAAAYVTPVVLGITGSIFFSLTLFSTQLSPFIAALGTTPLMAAVLVGAAQNILSKSAKYSLFDPCKEMAYIPLDAEQKSKGKAAVDVIGNPLGKSGGSFIQQVRPHALSNTRTYPLAFPLF